MLTSLALLKNLRKSFFLPPTQSLKMISYGGVEVSIIFTINLFLSDHTGTLPIFSEKMVLMFARHGHCTESWLHKLFIIKSILKYFNWYIKQETLRCHLVQNFWIFYVFCVAICSWYLVIWMRYIVISNALHYAFNFVKILKS